MTISIDGETITKEQRIKDLEELINDQNNEINRLQDVIDNLHTDIRNISRQKRKLEQVNINLYEIIGNYQIIYETLKE